MGLSDMPNSAAQAREAFTALLDELMQRHNIRQVDLAAALDIKRSRLTNWANGYQPPSRQEIELLLERIPWTTEEKSALRQAAWFARCPPEAYAEICDLRRKAGNDTGLGNSPHR